MKKRLRKKMNKKVFKAIYELNQQIAKDLNMEFVEDGLHEVYDRFKNNPHMAKKVFKDHKKFVG